MTRTSFLPSLPCLLPTLLVLALVALLAGCGDGRPDRDPPPPTDPVEVVVDVQIEPAAVTLAVGETFTLAALVTTETTEPALRAEPADVTWESKSSAIVSVASDGTLEALAPGTALVTATAGGITAEAVVTVREPDVDPPPVVDDLQLSETVLTLVVGADRQLTAVPVDAAGAPVPGATVAWSTLDASVATVSASGLVHAAGPGETRVRATSGDVSADVIVKAAAVEPPPPTGVASVELSETAVSLAEGTSRTLVATPRDANGAAIGGLAVRWRTSDEGVVYVTAGGELRAVRAGAADVTATVHGKVATARVTVTLDTPYDLFYEVHVPALSRFHWMTRDVRDPAAPALVLMAGSVTSAQPVPSPAGDRIAFTLSNPLSTSNQLRVVDLHRETIWYFEVPGQVQDVTWSWDGAYLAFALRSEETGLDVWTVRADGTGEVNLTAALGVGNDTQPTFSPAEVGKLAFTRAGVDGTTRIWTVNLNGSNAAPLTTGVADADPAWSPDGTSIAFQRSGAATFGDLFFVSPMGAIQRSLYGVPGIQARPAWSPDGKLVAFTSGGDVYTVRTTDSFLSRRTFDGDATVELRPGWLKRR